MRWALGCLVVACGLVACGEASPSGIIGGRADLSTWEPVEEPLINLEGTWSMSRGALIGPSEALAGAAPTWVPGRWPEDPLGSATYRLQLVLPDEAPPLILSFEGVSTVGRAWLDDELIAEFGDPETDRMDTRDVRAAIHVSGPVTLTLQVWNPAYRVGGVLDGVFIGTAEGVIERRTIAAVLSMATVAILSALGVLFLVLFASRRREPVYRDFGGLAVLVALREALGGPGEIGYLFAPELSWELALRVEYMALCAASYFGFSVALRVAEVSTESLLARSTMAVAVFLALLTAVEPFSWLAGSLIASQVLLIWIAVVALPALARASWHGVDGARTMMVILAAFVAAYTFDILAVAGFIETPLRVGAYALVAVVSAQGVALTRSFAASFRDNELLTRALQRTHADLELSHAAAMRFVPFAFLDLLGRRSVSDVHRGDHTHAELQVLFTDIRGFTPLIESLGPERAFPFVNRYLAAMEPCVTDNGGFVNQYLGDAILALYPTPPDDAVQSAVQMCQALEIFNEADPEGPIRVGIGVGSGGLMLGCIGGESALRGGVIGDSVNHAARIEGMTKVYGAVVLIDETVAAGLSSPPRFQLRCLDRVVAKGRSIASEIFEVLDVLPEELLRRRVRLRPAFDGARGEYVAGRFVAALASFQALAEEDPEDAAVALYVKRCRELVADPPDDWDGITWLTEK